MTNGFGGIESFRAYSYTIHDATTSEDTKRIFQISQPFFRMGIPTVRKKTVSL